MLAKNPSNSAYRSLAHEFFELLLGMFGDNDAVKNGWLMPFDPSPSSFPRRQDRRRPVKRRRRAF